MEVSVSTKVQSFPLLAKLESSAPSRSFSGPRVKGGGTSLNPLAREKKEEEKQNTFLAHET